jgi:hypothetical protein
MTWWIIFCIVSLLTNVVFGLYIRFLVSKVSFVRDSKEDLIGELERFGAHVKGLHDNRLFYGDPIFLNLMQHGKQLRDYLDRYKEVYDVLEQNYELEEEDDIEEEVFSYER